MEERLVEAIAKAIEAAVAAEREACAKVAEATAPSRDTEWEIRLHAGRACHDVAAAIRARSAPVSKPDLGPMLGLLQDAAAKGEWLKTEESDPKPDDVDRPADHPSNWTSGPIVDLGGEA